MITPMVTRRRQQLTIRDLPLTTLDEWYEAQEALRRQKEAVLRATWHEQDLARTRDPLKDATLDTVWVGYVWRHGVWELGGFMRHRNLRRKSLSRNIRWMRRHFGVEKTESLCVKSLGDAQRNGPPQEPPQRHPSLRPDEIQGDVVHCSAHHVHTRSPYMHTRRLLHQALVVPSLKQWGCARVLAKGVVVAFLDAKKLNSKPSPVQLPGERLVAFADENGKLIPGWLAFGTKVSKTKATDTKLKTPLTHVALEDWTISAIDEIRDILYKQGITWPKYLKRWQKFKHLSRPLLRKAIRELGGAVLKTDGHQTLLEKLTIVLGGTLTQEARMAASRKISKTTRSRKQDIDEEDDEDLEDEGGYEDDEDEEEEERPRKKSKKGKAKGNGEERRSLVCSVGHQLLTYAVKVKADPTTLKLAKRMAADQHLSAKQYNQITDTLRERMANTKLKDADKVGLQKAIRGVRMCAARVA